MRIVCPTGEMRIRSDSWGNGMFGMPRGTTPDGSTKYHDGLDLIVEPGQEIVSMIDGTVEKIDIPYSSTQWYKGIQVANSKLRVEIWYMLPLTELVGTYVDAGQKLGFAQDISKKYGKHKESGEYMTPHVHLRVTMRAFTQISSNKYISFDAYIDPYILLPGV
jgi:hypothetical protein